MPSFVASQPVTEPLDDDAQTNGCQERSRRFGTHDGWFIKERIAK